MTALELRRAFGHFATGVTVVTARDAAGEPVGMTANSFASLSLEPPLVLWSISRRATHFEAFTRATGFAVHVLDAGQEALARRFAARGVDRFADLATTTLVTGAPVLERFHACFDCRLHALYEGGDHLIVVGEVLRIEQRPGGPLVFHQGRYGALAGQPAP